MPTVAIVRWATPEAARNAGFTILRFSVGFQVGRWERLAKPASRASLFAYGLGWEVWREKLPVVRQIVVPPL